jgi:hypothetical protein
MTTIYAGLDIAKLNLQLHLAGRGHELPNTAAGHRRLLKLLAAQPGAHVVCEASGGYEREVVAALQQAGVPLSVLNPARVRDFARATGQRAKTDPIDAAVLAAFGQTLHPKPTAPRSPLDQQLTELVRRRVQIVEALVAQRLQAQSLTLPFCGGRPKVWCGGWSRRSNKSKLNSKRCGPRPPSWINAPRNFKPSKGWAPSRPWACWLNCPNWAPSIAARPPLWPDWRPIRGKAANGAAAE